MEPRFRYTHTSKV